MLDPWVFVTLKGTIKTHNLRMEKKNEQLSIWIGLFVWEWDPVMNPHLLDSPLPTVKPRVVGNNPRLFNSEYSIIL